MNCTAAPRFEEQFPESTSEYAEEGRLAHSFCELKVQKKFTALLNRKQYDSKFKKLKKDPLYSDEMDRTSDRYIEYLTEKAMSYDSPPLVSAEVKVDFSEYAPEGFGTCDCIMIGGDMLNIVDYKHGKGVPVSAENNAQMRLYALGALKKYEPFYGDIIKNVCMTIYQPRLSDIPSNETLTAPELKAWGETVKPLAQKAFAGFGEFVPGEHCRFCRGKAQCAARAKVNTALEDFKDCVKPVQAESKPDARILTNSEIGSLLIRGQYLVSWYEDLKSYALGAILNGEDIPGWKAVEGRSNRTFSNQDDAIATVIAAGYEEAMVYERKAKTLTQIEDLMGKEAFKEKLGQFVIKPPGKPTLATLSDKRPPFNSAVADFAEVSE